MSKGFKITMWILGGFILVIIILGVIGSYEETETAKPEPVKKQSKKEVTTLEYKLATINAGRYVPEDHITIARFRSLLNQLSYTYVENQQQIADMSVRAQEILKDDGIEESLLNIMEGMNRIFPRKIENQKYAEYSAAYLTLRDKGQSHREAIEGLKALVQALINN